MQEQTKQDSIKATIQRMWSDMLVEVNEVEKASADDPNFLVTIHQAEQIGLVTLFIYDDDSAALERAINGEQCEWPRRSDKTLAFPSLALALEWLGKDDRLISAIRPEPVARFTEGAFDGLLRETWRDMRIEHIAMTSAFGSPQDYRVGLVRFNNIEVDSLLISWHKDGHYEAVATMAYSVPMTTSGLVQFMSMYDLAQWFDGWLNSRGYPEDGSFRPDLEHFHTPVNG